MDRRRPASEDVGGFDQGKRLWVNPGWWRVSVSERTDQERGTEPETTDDWIRDLEGDSDTPAEDTAPGSEPERTTDGAPSGPRRDDQR